MGRTTARPDPLGAYHAKRRFDRTPEPKGGARSPAGQLYTIQKHDARRLHYDLRLELDGVLKSWAITRGPSTDSAVKRLAVRTEDHPLEYATFEGRIPDGNYGAGTVLLWDRGSWRPVEDPHAGLANGKLVFELDGERLRGRWALVRFKGKEASRRENWLLIKERDDEVERDRDITAEHQTSVSSGRSLDAIAAAPEDVWQGRVESGGAAHPSARSRASKPVAATRAGGKQARPGAALPKFVEPALATLVDEVPDGDGWLFEVKLDGYRAIAAASGERAVVYTRSGLDWTDRYPAIARALRRLGLDGVLLDGEIVAVDAAGRSDFSALHRALERGGTADLSYFVFDLLAAGGEDLRRRPLTERKRRLRALLGDAGRAGPVYFTDHVEGDGAAMLEMLCRSGHEGVVAKRANAPYRSGRSRSWLKVKCGRDQEFVVVGWSPSTTSRAFSSLLLGARDGDALRYVGRVGSGFSESDLDTIGSRLAALARKTPAVEGDIPAPVRRGARWVRPELVVQVAFAEFTGDGLIRHGRFVGLREDKPARSVRREAPRPVAESRAVTTERTSPDDEAMVGGVRLSHPDKVLYPAQGVTKRELAHYLLAVGDRMMPHVGGRLLSLVRCPQGSAGKCFFQRHGGAGLPEQFHRQAIAGKDSGEQEYLYVDAPAALVAAAQMGVLEFHIWGSRIDDIDRPDRLVFDLDPDPSVGFADVKHAARRLRDALDALGLVSFPLVTGGKGVHVVAPLARRHAWPTVKAFAAALAGRFAADEPDRYVATMRKARRKGRVFIDHFRNDRTATAIAPYSPRARADATLAWPLDWDGLDAVTSADAFRLREVDPGTADPWTGYADLRQPLKAASLRALGVEPE